MADTQKGMQLFKQHPLSSSILPPAHVLPWELNPDASSEGNVCERKTMTILVALAWFDGLIGSFLSLLLQRASSFPFHFQFVSGCINV